MTTPAAAAAESPRHLRSREGPRKSSSANESGVLTLMSEEDAEMAAVVTASHYLEHRGLSSKRKQQDSLITIHNTPKKPRTANSSFSHDDSSTSVPMNYDLSDVYCWECHKECVDGSLDCFSCPRTFHSDCLQSTRNYSSTVHSQDSDSPWTCPVCLTGKVDTWAMQLLTADQFRHALCFALQRMKHPDSYAFHNPVPKSLLPDYYDIIFHPMDLATLEKNVRQNMYNSTDGFLEAAKWILHNSVIYNGATSKYTSDAKLVIKICKHEMSEIEICPDCYLNSCYRKDMWFTDPCTYPHCLVWARLKGFPYWPAKALRVSSNGSVDVRFFGAHDRAWIPTGQCFLVSLENPNPVKNVRKFGFDKAVAELKLHIEKLGKIPNVNFRYAPFRTEFKSEHISNCAVLFGESFGTDDRRDLLAKPCIIAADLCSSPNNDRSIRGHSILRSTSSCSSTNFNEDETLMVDRRRSSPSCDSAAGTLLAGVSDVCGSTATSIAAASAEITASNGRPPAKARKQITRPTTTAMIAGDGNCRGSAHVAQNSQSSYDYDNSCSVFDRLRVVAPNFDSASTLPRREFVGIRLKAIDFAAVAAKSSCGTPGSEADVGPPCSDGAAGVSKLPSGLSITQSAQVAPTLTSNILPVLTVGSEPVAEMADAKVSAKSTSVSSIKRRTLQSVIARMTGAASKLSPIKAPSADGFSFATSTMTSSSPIQMTSSARTTSAQSKLAKTASSLTLTSQLLSPMFKSASVTAVKQNARRTATGCRQPAPPPPPNVTLSPPRRLNLPLHATMPKSTAAKQPTATAIVTATSALPLTQSMLPNKARDRLVEKYFSQTTQMLKSTFESLIDEAWNEHMLENIANNADTTGDNEGNENALHSDAGVKELKWFYQEAIRAMNSTAKTSISEMQQTSELKHAAEIELLKKKFEEEKATAVKETKQKQWCAFCGKEAVFYCCWNTSYCDYPCQQQHWPAHQTSCAQIRQSMVADFSSQQKLKKKKVNFSEVNLPSFSAMHLSFFSHKPTYLCRPNTCPLVTQQHVNSIGAPPSHHLSVVQSAGQQPNVVPVYAAGYYKTVALDGSSGSAPQFLAIQPPRQTSTIFQQQRSAATYPSSAVGLTHQM